MPFERTPYMEWLLRQSSDENHIAWLIFRDCADQQRPAFDLLEATGKEEFSWPESFVAAAQIVIQSE